MSVQNTMAGEGATTSLVSRTAPIAAALAAVVWGAGSAVLLLLPGGGERFTTPADYAGPVVFLLGVVLTGVALAGLQCRQEGRAGRLGQVGYWLIVVPFALLVVQTAAELVVGGEALGPLYPIGAVASRLGFILWGIAAYRAAVLPRWLGPAVALAWVIAPPLGPIAAIFALPVAWAAAALAVSRPAGSTK
jgi:hypothetical protein